MNQEPKAVRILKGIIIGSVLLLIPVSFFAEGTIKLKVGHENFILRPFELLFFAIPLIGLLLVYECIRGVAMAVKKRRMIAAMDEAFVARLTEKSARRGNPTRTR